MKYIIIEIFIVSVIVICAVIIIKTKVLYRAVISEGTKLIASEAMVSAVKGFYRGANDIKGHANLVKSILLVRVLFYIVHLV